ncbi:similar to N-acetylglucosaminyltransferase [Leptolyngbya sp. NIES-3755]|nr:similar to N-acetylglucosaminyltransferase [Leptolyngbya sp. NIES-3755]
MQHNQLILFDLAVGGHHGAYLWNFVSDWKRLNVPASLSLVVAPQFVEQHAEVVDLIRQSADQSIHLFPISAEELANIKRQRSSIARAFAEWDIFCHYATRLQATQGLLMYFDPFQLPIVFGKRSPCPVSGIYFRPTFHYAEFGNFRPTWKEAIRQWRQKLLLTLSLRSGQLNSLFCIDPYAIDAISALSPVKAIHLSDPIKIDHALIEQDLRSELGIERDRKILLLFGRVSGRKGIHQLLESIQHLDPATCEKICLLIVGEIPASERSGIHAQIETIAPQTTAQIILDERYVTESEVSAYFQLADIVLAPYQRHVGMSGILLQAAAAQKPVLSSNYGLMGRLTEQYELGLAVQSEDAIAIARGIDQMLNSSIEDLCKLEKMNELTQLNLAEKFSTALISHLVPDTVDALSPPAASISVV